MRTVTPPSLRDRLTPPPARQPSGRAAEIERVLRLATELFGVAAAALVESTPAGLQLQASWSSGPWDQDDAVTAAQRLLDVLETSDVVGPTRGAGVLEEIGAQRGFRAAAPVLSPDGQTLGALCLIDPDRRALLSGLHRRLLAELGDLCVAAFDLRPNRQRSSSTDASLSGAADALLRAADRYPEPIAIFDEDGKCLLRNSLFASLLGSEGTAIAGNAAPSAISNAQGREAEWLANRLSRETMPVGIYRVCRADGTWICVEERRSPRGRSLMARIETEEAYGGDLDGAALFERCPSPMFVFDRGTRRMTAVNAAALAFYGWDRDAFLVLPLETIGPLGRDPDQEGTGPGHGFAEAERWVHRNRAGEALYVAGRTAALTYRGRPSVLVAVTDHASSRRGAVAVR